MLKSILLVSAGGAFGSGLRYLTALFTQKYIGQTYYWGTLIANILGCLLIGILMGYFTKSQFSNSEYKLLLVTGFCGGYTTFSAFAFENFSLFQQGNYSAALLYTMLSVSGGIIAVVSGFALIRI